jgi:signal transduction histidine kinase
VGAFDIMRAKIHRGQTRDLSRLLEVASMSLNRTSSLTRSLLAFARPHSFDLKRIDVNTVIRAMEDLIHCTLGDRIKLELVLTEGLSWIVCDPHQFENSILNLTINARNAMPDGGRLLIETCHAKIDDDLPGLRQGSYIGICVADTGAGMAAEVAARAFEPFYTTRPRGFGTGLGLTMTRHFVERFRGRVDIETAVGRGTSVMIYLPCRKDEQDDLGRTTVDPANSH